MDPTQAPQAPTLPQYQPAQPQPAQQVPTPAPPGQQQPQGQGQQPQHLQGQQPQGQQPQEPAQPNPDFQRPPARAGESRVAPIWIPPDEWTATQSKLRMLEEFKTQQDQILEMKEAERIRALAEKGQIEEAFNQIKTQHEKKQQELQARLEQREQAWLNEKMTQEINAALMGRNFLGGDDETRQATADMLRSLLAMELEAIIGPNGAPLVRDKTTLRPASDYLKERLDSPKSKYHVFLAPLRPSGGSGTDGARPPANTMSAPPPALSPEETVRAWQAPTQKPIEAFGIHPLPRRA